MRWLDAARYADTNGYQTDAERSMWRWRDWVIDAFNRNLPYDRFTVEQIAGDLLPDATREQRVATGFNRNHRGNGEGGIIPEEYAVEYVVDRVDTTSTVFLGLTLGCARCHNHKFDPFTQKEFYQMFAYFNQVPERGNAFKYGNSPPTAAAPTPEQESQLAERWIVSYPRRRQQATGAGASAYQRATNAGKPLPPVNPNSIGRHRARLPYISPLNGNLEGEITPDPPRSEKYLYLMENGRIRKDCACHRTSRMERWGRRIMDTGPLKQAAEFDGQALYRCGQCRRISAFMIPSPFLRGSIPLPIPARS